VFSLLLAGLGEPRGRPLLEPPMSLLGCPRPPWRGVALAVALMLVVVAHMLLGRDGAPQHRPRSPERAAMLLVPPFLCSPRPRSRGDAVQPDRPGRAAPAAGCGPEPSSKPRSPPASSPC
jgi:hypothetical protein